MSGNDAAEKLVLFIEDNKSEYDAVAKELADRCRCARLKDPLAIDALTDPFIDADKRECDLTNLVGCVMDVMFCQTPQGHGYVRGLRKRLTVLGYPVPVVIWSRALVHGQEPPDAVLAVCADGIVAKRYAGDDAEFGANGGHPGDFLPKETAEEIARVLHL